MPCFVLFICGTADRCHSLYFSLSFTPTLSYLSFSIYRYLLHSPKIRISRYFTKAWNFHDSCPVDLIEFAWETPFVRPCIMSRARRDLAALRRLNTLLRGIEHSMMRDWPAERRAMQASLCVLSRGGSDRPAGPRKPASQQRDIGAAVS